ncbi:MAG: hypothetical protein Q8S39_08075 [Ignavibacteria bacterium]|nr:hypothetical protein [Ignavibacteria bacterium]
MVRKLFKYLGIISIIFIYACNQTDVTDPNEKPSNKNLKMVVDKNEYQNLETLRKSGKGVSDPFTIEKVEVVKDSLAITVSYMGAVSFWGTKLEHSFTLCWSGDVSILIYPMPANLILTHDAKGYSGNTKYIETLMFSLKDLGINDSKDYTFNVFSDLNSSDKPDDSSDNVNSTKP